MTKEFPSIKQLCIALGISPDTKEEDMSIIIKGANDEVLTEMPVRKLFEGLYKITKGQEISLNEDDEEENK